MSKLLTQTEWAKEQGVSRQYVNKLVKEGIIELVNGKIDPEQAEMALAAIRDHSLEEKRNTQSSEHKDLSRLLLQSRIKTEVERGKLLELKSKLESGQLIPADDVKKQAFDAARKVRDGLLNIPDRVASMLAHESDEHVIHQLLTKEIRIVLEDLSS